MRTFIVEHVGATLGDAVAHWYATRSTGPRPIDAQFELNRFTLQWYTDHPGGTRTQLNLAWMIYRTTPTDQRTQA